MQKVLIALGILLVVAVIFGINLSGGGLELFGNKKDEVQAVTVFKARYAKISASVSAPGTVMAAQEVQVPSQVNGSVKEILVKEGDAVKQGDVLIRLDARDIEAEIKSAELELAAAHAKENVAEIDLATAKRELDDRKASLHRLGRSTAAIDGAEAEERAQLADLKKAEDNYRRYQSASVASVGAKAIAEAKEQYNAAKARYEAAQQKVKQANQDLLKSDVQEERELAKIDGSYQHALANVDMEKEVAAQAEAKVAIAREKLEKTVIKAPLTGKVIRINVAPNAVVTPGTMNNEPTSLVTVADISQMLVAAAVDESDIREIELGRVARVRMDAFPDVKFAGAVERIAQTADKDAKSNVSTFKVLVGLKEPADQLPRLRSGLTAHCDIVTVTRPRALVIKIPAVQSRSAADAASPDPGGDRKVDPASKVRVVFVVEGDLARMRPLKDGIMDESFVEVVDGVKDGDEVVVGPGRVLDRLRDRDRVRIEQTEP